MGLLLVVIVQFSAVNTSQKTFEETSKLPGIRYRSKLKVGTIFDKPSDSASLKRATAQTGDKTPKDGLHVERTAYEKRE